MQKRGVSLCLEGEPGSRRVTARSRRRRRTGKGSRRTKRTGNRRRRRTDSRRRGSKRRRRTESRRRRRRKRREGERLGGPFSIGSRSYVNEFSLLLKQIMKS